MEVYMLMVLAIHSPLPNHGFGVYPTMEEAENAKATAIQARPDIPGCWYTIYKLRMGEPIAMGIASE